MRKRFFYYAFGSSRKERSDGTAIVRQRRNRVNDIIINEKKLTGDCDMHPKSWTDFWRCIF